MDIPGWVVDLAKDLAVVLGTVIIFVTIALKLQEGRHAQNDERREERSDALTEAKELADLRGDQRDELAETVRCLRQEVTQLRGEVDRLRNAMDELKETVDLYGCEVAPTCPNRRRLSQKRGGTDAHLPQP